MLSQQKKYCQTLNNNFYHGNSLPPYIDVTSCFNRSPSMLNNDLKKMALSLSFFIVCLLQFPKLWPFLTFYFFCENLALDQKMVILGFLSSFVSDKKQSVKIHTMLQEKIIKNHCQVIFGKITKISCSTFFRLLVAIFYKKILSQ